MSGIPLLNGTNFSIWKEQLEICLGVLEMDQALRMDKPEKPKDDAADEAKTAYAKWERSNRISLMIMKSTISLAIRGGIPEKNVAGELFTAKEFLTSVEEQFKSTSKAVLS
ncbi:hypothetical protein LUZ62_064536 [Rhynchospora pubera]|uniref:UBN2_3 domain-containing protein n=1 Tax=Rhynchospora pubera TaxID=906938 RepID=A0AAV8ELS8_9POAL|nr:hypothetical protein LUZ62_064536 [Rhynchospora pubera]